MFRGINSFATIRQNISLTNKNFGLSQFATDPQNVTTGNEGGYGVQTDIASSVVKAMKAFGNVRQYSNVFRSEKGNPHTVLTNNDTSNVSTIVAENTNNPVLTTTFSRVTFGQYTYRTRLDFTIESLRDTQIDFVNFMGKTIGERHARGVEADFATGNGTSAPQGFITGGTQGTVASVAGTPSATTLDYKSTVDFHYSLDPAYRNAPGACYQVSDSLAKELRKLISTTGQPIWQQSMQVGQPDLLHGKPCVINNNVAAIATNAKVGAFGDFLGSYWIREVGDIQLIRNDFVNMATGVVSFYSWYVVDAKVMAPSSASPIVYIQMSPGT